MSGQHARLQPVRGLVDGGEAMSTHLESIRRMDDKTLTEYMEVSMPKTIELKKGDAAMVFHADGTMEAMMPRMEDGEVLSPTSIDLMRAMILFGSRGQGLRDQIDAIIEEGLDRLKEKK